MTAESWAVLLSLALAGALMPGPIVVTTLLLRARGGIGAGASFVAGMTVVRLAQGVAFGFALRCRRGRGLQRSGNDRGAPPAGPGDRVLRRCRA